MNQSIPKLCRLKGVVNYWLLVSKVFLKDKSLNLFILKRNNGEKNFNLPHILPVYSLRYVNHVSNVSKLIT